MKKFFLLTLLSMVTVSMMAIGNNSGSTKANAIDFDWSTGVEHQGGTKWYRVDLAPLYEEENPSLTLYLTNPSNEVGTSVDVSMKATVAGETESKDYSIAARQYKTYTANASLLVRLKQTEIYLTLTSNGRLKLSAKVFEAADLDETCKDARTLNWNTLATQAPSYSAWWKVSLNPIKNVTGKDAKITLRNTGTATVTLKVGQSMDCPSSGLTKRTYVLAPGESVSDTVPRSMIMNVQPDEIYFGIENVESPISILVEPIDQPAVPVIFGPAVEPAINLHVTDTIVIPAGRTLYKVSVADMDSMMKYEPEFTYRNEQADPANMTIKMAFERPAYGTSNTDYELAPGEEEIVVYKKNMLAGLADVDSIFLLTITDQPINFYGRYKHVREGKACKTNIDFNWETGHVQEARTTQWYAVDVTAARNDLKDIMVYAMNLSGEPAKVKTSFAFSCPYIDLQEMERTLAVGNDTVSRRVVYSTYALLSDVVWFGLETDQEVRFWADTVAAQTKDDPDPACLSATDFNWEQGVHQNANDTTWYRIDMTMVRESAAKFPTLSIQNFSTTDTLTLVTEQSLECPDQIENEVRTIKIEPSGSYESKISRNLFEHISQNELWVRLTGNCEFALQVRLTEESAGASCMSAVPFNWVSGNVQDANANVWYSVDLRDVMKSGNDIKLHIKNNDNEPCKGYAQLIYSCPSDEEPSLQNFNLAKSEERKITVQASAFEMVDDSTIYVNVQGSTSIRFWVEVLPPEDFDTIYADGLTLIPLQWDSLYTQTEDTVWYIIPQSEIEKVRNLDEKQKPVAHVINLGSEEISIKGEAAFAFPITKKMMTKTKDLKAGAHFTDTIPAGTFDQFLKKDSIIIRVTRPKGTAAFQFRAELVKAFSGNDRKDAIPFPIGKIIEQSANSAIWYKMRTADWKKNPNMYNKSLKAFTKNVGTTTADITVEAYDGYDSDVNLLEGRGSIRSPQGEIRRRTIPAQVIYGLGDVEVYFRVTTTDTLIFETFLDSEYAPAPVDPMQDSAKLLVPNVDYTIPGDNEAHWYRVCVPYLRNNYRYVHAGTLTYELFGKTTIEATATLSDNLDFAMPVRTRTINTAGGHRFGEKALPDLVAEAASRGAHRNLDISSFHEDYVDSMLHRYITDDSISVYVRIKSDKDIKARLNLPQITGDACVNFMEFDWEHGNVNAAGKTNWIRVQLDESRVPEGKDLMLHLDNWASGSTDVDVEIYPGDCSAALEGSLHRTLVTDTTKVLERQLLATWGWTNLMFKYTSDSATHIWAEIVDHIDRDTIEKELDSLYVCPNTQFEDEYDHVLHTIDPSDPTSWTWTTPYDSIDKSEAKITTYMYTYHVLPLQEPDAALYPITSMLDKIVITRGKVLDMTAASAALFAQITADHQDSIMYVDDVDSIRWEYSLDNVTFYPIPATPIASEAVVLRYLLLTECTEDTVFSAPYYNSTRDTLDVPDACKSYTWEGNTYTESKLDSVTYPLANGCDSIAYLNLTILPPVTGNDSALNNCYFFTWDKGDGKTYYNDTIVTFTYDGGAANGCDSIVTMKIKVNSPYQFDLSLVAKYGDRLLMINRNEINAKDGWNLDLENDTMLVKWYKEATPADEFLGYGYYYTKSNGDVLDPGVYYAVVEIPAVEGEACGAQGETTHYTVAGAAPAPALVPSLARPGEDVMIINLDPEKETVIRVFTTEGLLHGAYTVRGETSFTIKAANEAGFYIVELNGEDMKSTLRYIVK